MLFISSSCLVKGWDWFFNSFIVWMTGRRISFCDAFSEIMLLLPHSSIILCWLALHLWSITLRQQISLFYCYWVLFKPTIWHILSLDWLRSLINTHISPLHTPPSGPPPSPLLLHFPSSLFFAMKKQGGVLGFWGGGGGQAHCENKIFIPFHILSFIKFNPIKWSF